MLLFIWSQVWSVPRCCNVLCVVCEVTFWFAGHGCVWWVQQWIFCQGSWASPTVYKVCSICAGWWDKALAAVVSSCFLPTPATRASLLHCLADVCLRMCILFTINWMMLTHWLWSLLLRWLSSSSLWQWWLRTLPCRDVHDVPTRQEYQCPFECWLTLTPCSFLPCPPITCVRLPCRAVHNVPTRQEYQRYTCYRWAGQERAWCQS